MDANVGKRVKVMVPGPRMVERVLLEDYKGLFVKYKNEIIRVKPRLNDFGENNTNSYVKIFEGGN